MTFAILIYPFWHRSIELKTVQRWQISCAWKFMPLLKQVAGATKDSKLTMLKNKNNNDQEKKKEEE